MEKPDTFLSLEDFQNRCEKDAKLLEDELGSYLSRRGDWDFVFDHGGPTFRLDLENGPTLGVVLPVGKDGWRIPMIRLKKK